MKSANPARAYWQWINIQTVVRPPRTTPEDRKDEMYDANCARFYLGNQSDITINRFRRSYYDNVAYTLGQWGEEQDVKTFLKDKGRSTSRVAFKHPLIQPILTRLRGAADNISVSPIAEPATQYAKTRKENDLARALALSLAARQSPAISQALQPMGITGDEEQDMNFHENTYHDELIVAITSLMKMISLRNGLDDMKMDVAKHIALSGLAAWHCSTVGQNLVWELCEPDEVGWDPAAIKSDFSDGEYWFTCPVMDVSQIAERWNSKKDVIEQIDKWANISSNGYSTSGWPQQKPRVITLYFKDCKPVERGYVLEDDELVYTTINEPDPSKKDGTPKYTDKDLQDPPENEFTATWTNSEWKNKKQRRYIEYMRYCSFIPWEYLPGAVTGGVAYADRKSAPEYAKYSDTLGPTGDLILDNGVCSLQEANPDDTFSKGSPLKFTTWTYIAGNVIAPLTAAISPQRVMNQITSDLMYRLRKAGHKSPAIDTDAMAGSTMTEQEIAFAMKEGDLINLKGALVGGLQNAVRDIDTSPGDSFYKAFSLVPEIKAMSESAVGVFEAGFGAPQGPGQLVGTLQLQLQQQGVMQQPFYKAIANLYKQVHQFNAQAGKQFYAARPWILKQMVGDVGADVLKLCKDLQNEQFRIEITLTANSAEMRIITDREIIPMRMQMGVLGPQEAAELLGRAFPSDVDRAGREFVRRQALAQQQQQQAEAQAMEAQTLAEQEALLEQQENEQAKQADDFALKNRQVDVKETAPFRQSAADWDKPGALQEAMGDPAKAPTMPA